MDVSNEVSFEGGTEYEEEVTLTVESDEIDYKNDHGERSDIITQLRVHLISKSRSVKKRAAITNAVLIACLSHDCNIDEDAELHLVPLHHLPYYISKQKESNSYISSSLRMYALGMEDAELNADFETETETGTGTVSGEKEGELFTVINR